MVTGPLSDEQRRVVESRAPLVVCCGPTGAGKTTALLWRFLEEARDVGVERLLYLARNAAAARQFQEQLVRLLPDDSAPLARHAVVTFRTFAREQVVSHHAQLGFRGPPMVQDADVDWDWKRRLLASGTDPADWPRYGKYLGVPWLLKEVFDRALRAAENALSDEDVELRDLLVPEHLGWKEADRFLSETHRQLRERGVLDQSGVLRAFRELLGQNDVVGQWRDRFAVLLVDDAEDCFPLQSRFVETLTDGFRYGRSVVAGDTAGSPRVASGADPAWFAYLCASREPVRLLRNFVVGEAIGATARGLMPGLDPGIVWAPVPAAVQELPLGTTYAEMLDHVAVWVAAHALEATRAAPLAVVVPDVGNTAVVTQLQGVMTAAGVEADTLHGSRRITDDPFGRATWVACQLAWPDALGGEPDVPDSCALLRTLFKCSPDEILGFKACAESAGSTVAGMLAAGRWATDHLHVLRVFVERLNGLGSSEGRPLPELVRAVVDGLVLPALQALELRAAERVAAAGAAESLADAARRYADQMAASGIATDLGAAFAEALDDPGFAPLSQESETVRSRVVVASPQRLLERGERLTGIVLLDLCDGTWVGTETRPLADASLLSAQWQGTARLVSDEREAAFRQVALTLGKLMLLANRYVCIARSALTPTGEPTSGARLLVAIRQGLRQLEVVA